MWQLDVPNDADTPQADCLAAFEGLNEISGADAKEVERGLTTDPRIGPRAYLKPGQAFAGGTLARDVGFRGRRWPSGG
jgi:hypothetical protein